MTTVIVLLWISESLGRAGFICMLISLALIFIFFIASIEGEMVDAWGKLKYIAIPVILVGTLALFNPSKETIYMYAASQGLEEITKLPEFEKTRKLLNKTLDKMVEDKG